MNFAFGSGQRKAEKRRDISVERLERADVIVTSYAVIGIEFSEKRDEQVVSKLSQIKFRRLVLDEAHYVRNGGRIFNSVLRINAVFRWCVTGTPLQNRILDLHPLFAVIQEEVFSNRRNFKM